MHVVDSGGRVRLAQMLYSDRWMDQLHGQMLRRLHTGRRTLGISVWCI